MKNFLPVILMVLLFSLSIKTTAQEESQPEASINIKTQGSTSPMLQYLFNTYGIEASERILLNIKDYEKENGVFVLYGDQYSAHLNLIETEISKASGIQEKNTLKRRKNTIIDLQSIESIVTN